MATITYTFEDLLNDPLKAGAFDPALHSLLLGGAATEISVKFSLANGTTTFTKIINGEPKTVTIRKSPAELDTGAIVTNGGLLAFGDNNTLADADALGNAILGNATLGNQYHGLSGADTFHGGAAGDLAYGNKDGDVLLGGGGADSLYGGQGNDWIETWDAAFTNAVNTATVADSADSQIYGNFGSDTQISGNGNDVHYGGQGIDLIWSYGGSDVVYGNKGDDVLNGGTGQDTLYGGQGADSIDGDGLVTDNQVIYGQVDADTILSGFGGDTIYGGQGDDYIVVNSYGGGGQLIRGNLGDDFIYGTWGASDDTLEGNGGSDTIHAGNYGKDLVNGGAGDDLIHGGNSASELNGDEGADTIHAGNDGDTVKGNTGNDLIYGGVNLQIDTAGGETGEFIHGGAGDDTIYLGGNDGAGIQTVFGGDNNDSIVGHHGSNMLIGGAGSDTIVAGWYGSDTMDGSAGTDVDYFVWNSRAAVHVGSASILSTVSNAKWISASTSGGAGGIQTTANTPSGWAYASAKSFNWTKTNTTKTTTLSSSRWLTPTLTWTLTSRWTSTSTWVHTPLSSSTLTWTGWLTPTWTSTWTSTWTTTWFPVTYTNTFWTGTIDLVYSQGRTANMDRVDNFQAGIDKLVFDATGVFNNGSAGDVKIAVGAAGATAKKILSVNTVTTKGAGLSGIKLIGTYGNTKALKSAMQGGLVTSIGNQTGTTIYGFAANSGGTLLWLVSLHQQNANVTIESGSILGTINIPGGMASGDILVV